MEISQFYALGDKMCLRGFGTFKDRLERSDFLYSNCGNYSIKHFDRFTLRHKIKIIKKMTQCEPAQPRVESNLIWAKPENKHFLSAELFFNLTKIVLFTYFDSRSLKLKKCMNPTDFFSSFVDILVGLFWIANELILKVSKLLIFGQKNERKKKAFPSYLSERDKFVLKRHRKSRQYSSCHFRDVTSA